MAGVKSFDSVMADEMAKLARDIAEQMNDATPMFYNQRKVRLALNGPPHPGFGNGAGVWVSRERDGVVIDTGDEQPVFLNLAQVRVVADALLRALAEGA